MKLKKLCVLLTNGILAIIIGLFIVFSFAHLSSAQAISDDYANNETSIDWQQVKTEHFKIVFPASEREKIPTVSQQAERIYGDFEARMGTAPCSIIIYIKNENAVVSGIKAQKTDEEFSIWDDQAPSGERFIPQTQRMEIKLRREIAYAFQQHGQYFPVDYYYYLFSRPEKSPWSDGFTSFMAIPNTITSDANHSANADIFFRPGTMDSLEIMRGRSQIRYFLDRYGGDAFKTLYSTRQSFLGIPYFDFNSSFETATGLGYDTFTRQWLSNHTGSISDISLQAWDDLPAQSDTSVSSGVAPITDYNAFTNIRWEPPFVLPYYVSTDDFGLAAYLSLAEPMQTHEFRYYGSISFADPVGKSFFYSKYTNNAFRPQIEFILNRFPSASGFFGKSRKVKTATIMAVESLWKLTGISHRSSQWYGGLTLRHMIFDYFSAESFRYHHPDLFLNNTHTRQIDVKASLAWRNFTAGRHALIHPMDGEGVRFSVTGSEKILGSQTRHLRLNLDGYTIWPGFGDDRIYLYGNGVMDIGEPAGHDYLSFSDDGDYQLPGPDFTGSVNPGFDRFVRGYTTNLVGDRFAFGTLEYRIPFFFDTREKLLGFIPPARTSLTLFADAGVMGAARTGINETSTEYRYSAGVELKRVFSIGGSFELTYEGGVAQPLTKSFGPTPYFNIKTALPF